MMSDSSGLAAPGLPRAATGNSHVKAADVAEMEVAEMPTSLGLLGQNAITAHHEDVVRVRDEQGLPVVKVDVKRHERNCPQVNLDVLWLHFFFFRR
jgi:hypothetical protein